LNEDNYESKHTFAAAKLASEHCIQAVVAVLSD